MVPVRVLDQVTVSNTIPSTFQFVGSEDPPRRRVPIVVVIPAYNEEGAIKRVVESTTKVLGTLANKMDVIVDHEIIVIDDGSKDKTRQILDSLGIHKFYHRKNMGKGYAIRNASRFIHNGEIVVLMDGDGEHDPSDIPCLVEPVVNGRADMTIGSRFMASRREVTTYLGREKKRKHVHVFGNRLFSFLLWCFTRKTITDTQSGFRAFKGVVLKSLRPSAEGFRIEMEMTVKAIKRNFTIVEVPVTNGHGARDSHLDPVIDGAKILLTIFRECLPRRVSWFFDWLLPRLPSRVGSLLG